MGVLSLAEHVIVDGTREVLLARSITSSLGDHPHGVLVETLDTVDATIVKLLSVHLHLLVARDGSPVVRQALIEHLLIFLFLDMLLRFLFSCATAAKLTKANDDINEDTDGPHEEAAEG